MILTLVGMSGAGKSYWSTRLEKECGFERFGCDDMIESALVERLAGIPAGDRLGQWMGLPFEGRYPENEKVYLEAEKKMMQKIFDSISSSSKNVVIDTTGSVIYLGDEVRERLRSLSKVVYFETPSEVRDLMFTRYVAAPRPVVWGSMFKQKKSESSQAALEASYRKLLTWREKQYASWSHVKLEYPVLRSGSLTTKEFLGLLGAS